MDIGLDPSNLGSAPKLENLSTLALYCTVKKTIRNCLLVTIPDMEFSAKTFCQIVEAFVEFL